MNKRELVDECAKILERPNVSKWYTENLEGKPQGDTLRQLVDAISYNPESRSHSLTVEEAIAIALIVGLQFTEKFQGVK
jgi:hypothetical protein